MNLIFDILKKDGYTDADIEILKANIDEQQDNFNLDEFLTRVSNKRKDLFLATTRQSILDEYEKENKEKNFLKIIVPVQNQLAKMANLTKEDAQGKDWRELLKVLEEKHQASLEERSSENDKELLVKLGKLQTDYTELKEDFKTQTEAWNEKITNTEKQAENKILTFKQRDFLSKRVRDKSVVEWDDDKKVPVNYEPNSINYILSNYHLDDKNQIWGDKEFTTKAVWKDGKTMIESPDQAIQLWAEYNHATKKSNGDGAGEDANGNKLQPNQIEVNGKVIDNTGAKALESFFNQ